MKVVCDSCQAKYQVPDERVAGKKLKIRCKKCAGTIIVRGDQLSAPATAQPEQGWQDEATVAVSRNEPTVEWFASVDGGEHGPMDEETLVTWLIEQPGAWDTYVWREGFGDWVLARYVENLTAAAEARGVTVDEEQGSSEVESDEEAVPTQMRPNALLEAQQGQPESMRAPASAPRYESFSVEPVAAASVSVADSAPSFASGSSYGSSPGIAASASYASSPGASASAPYGGSSAASQNYGQARAAASSPRVSAAAAMTGSRNEESVLFDASALQRVASPSRATTSSPALSSPRDGYATGDGSGLIDIRALAAMSAASAAKKEAEAAQPSEPLLPQANELPALDTLAPVAMPQQAPKRSSNAMPIALFGAAVVLAAAIVTVAVVLDTKEPSLEAPAAASAPIAPEPTPPALSAAAAEEPEEEAQAAPEEESAAEAEETAAEESAEAEAEAEAPEEEAAADKPAAGQSAKARAAARRRRLAAARKARAAKAEPAAAEPKEEEPKEEEPLFKDEPKAEEKAEAAPEAKDEGPSIDDLIAGTSSKSSEPAKSRSIDDLLDNAVDESAPSAKKPAAPAPSNLQAQPSRDDVLSAMRSVTPAVQRCGSQNGQSGVAKVKITVAGSGKVSDATASGVTGPAVGCIEQAVKKAKFPAFSKPSFTVNFPFRL